MNVAPSGIWELFLRMTQTSNDSLAYLFRFSYDVTQGGSVFEVLD